MTTPDATTVRQRIVESLYACRDHDAYWGRPTRGWRPPENCAIAAGRFDHVSTDTACRVLDELVAEGVAEARSVGPDGSGPREFRHREPVTPFGGDERMRQP